ncbi:UDP-glucose/GDP-mannose dehydrogenase with 6-phosphogluconate dehydrogenase at C-terminal end [Candidatus Moduliflexus flocculans]|uniref:UDP-glucose/GDP-mannose dehydrogenase with 6-phosphogluconate dehydrogenase at C-terminal end n=1 Tax=Candidatus Moduliflexus flocculans TaxID=1499966 RepID=A0A0S6W4C8_9BACT|nr:UDP-glucose/GDP-mannose dehydrogenase with 6-phosphogluconate dehydrogenase at C-terminal end [Candidatus Moduliflexus flocculans]
MSNNHQTIDSWQINKIVVIGPGIVGMPMAAMLAHARICEGTDHPTEVVVIQRNSATSGWKVAAINSGRSPIGGLEPDLDNIVAQAVASGLLRASHSYSEVREADVILVCVQTDKNGLGPDYVPLFDALTHVAVELQQKPTSKTPLIIFESTLAPSTMTTLIRNHFARYDLIEGRDILLGNSPNRVMPGRLVHRIMNSDKIVAGLNPQTPERIHRLYSKIVTSGTLYQTNSLTAEVVKTLENAYRDVRIAYAAEIVRYCDAHDFNFHDVRKLINTRLSQTDDASENPNAVPSGGLLLPTIGVGGHCLPKDGILLWWRKLASGADTANSLILKAREINDESPAATIRLAEQVWGALEGKSIALFGTAYRFNSEDTRNSPTIQLARQLLEKGCAVMMHDPYVKPDDQNLVKFDMYPYFTRDISRAVESADYLIFCAAHRIYADDLTSITQHAPHLKGVLDGCHLYPHTTMPGIGKGRTTPPPEFIDFVYDGFRAIETGVANEVLSLLNFLNDHYVIDDFNRAIFTRVQHIAGTCGTGCKIVDPGLVSTLPTYQGFSSRLAQCAYEHSQQEASLGTFAQAA